VIVETAAPPLPLPLPCGDHCPLWGLGDGWAIGVGAGVGLPPEEDRRAEGAGAENGFWGGRLSGEGFAAVGDEDAICIWRT
jgi:hypothetical protein